jgi:hypothetical protein
LPDKEDENQEKKTINIYTFPVEDLWRIAISLREKQKDSQEKFN